MKLGKRFILGIIDETEGFKPLAFAQSCSYDLSTTFVKVSSPNTGAVDCVRPKTTGWALQHEGLLGRSDVRYRYGDKDYTLMAFLTYAWKNRIALTAQWQENVLAGESGHDVQTKQGTCYIKSLKQVASEKALTKVSVALQGTGELQELSLDNLTGSFAYCISGTTLSLFATDRPIANFTVIAIASGTGTETTVGTWSATGERMQIFTVPAGSVGVKAAIIKDSETIDQPGIAFTDASHLNLVLVQTTEQHAGVTTRTVTAYWWGGVAMGDITVSKNNQNRVFSTTGKTGTEGIAVTEFPFDILTSGVSVTIGGPQTIDSVDRTASRSRVIEVTQTANNGIDWPANDYMTMTRLMLPDGTAAPFAQYLDVWGEQEGGSPAASVRIAPGQTSKDDPAYGLTPDETRLHFNIGGLADDNPGPYIISLRLVTDTEAHDVFYAYDATAQRLCIFCPDQVADAVLLAGGTTMLHSGKLYDLDSEGNRVPLTIDNVAAFSSLITPYGTYTFHDVSAVSMFNLSNTINIDKMPLYDIILTGEGGVQVGTLPALSSPERTYPTYELVDVPGSIITGAQMPSGAAQTVTYASYFGTVVLKSSVTQTGNDRWSLTASIFGNSDGSGGAAVLPYRLRLRYASNAAIYIEAGQSSVTASGLDYNPAWITPTATLITDNPAEITILTSPAVDITAAHWTAYKIGLVGGYYCYDIAYLGGTHPELSLTSGNFMFTPTVVKSGEQVADTLYRLTGSSEDNVSVSVKAAGAADWSAATIEHINVNTTDKLHLSYRLRNNSAGVTVTDLTNIIYPDVPEAPYSRKSNIADVLPRLSVMYRNQTVIYDAKSLEPLKPGKTEGEEFRVEARSGVYAADEVDTDARFTDSNNNVISVGTGLTGVVVHAVNHGADLPFD